MTTLAWGGVAYKAGYQSAGEWENLLAAVKWGTDYFIKCHTSDTEFYGQVGKILIFLFVPQQSYGWQFKFWLL